MKPSHLTTSLLAGIMVLGSSACSSNENTDLRTWMAEQGANARGKIQPLPPLRPYEAFTYNAFDLPDPFRPKKISASKGINGPDPNRRREALEAFNLETLTMVGTLQRGRTMVGLVRTNDKRVFQVRPGNHMGQDYGVITAITENDITLKELFQDGAGEWSERQVKITLQEREQKK